MLVGLLFLLMAIVYMVLCPIVGHLSGNKVDPRILVIMGYVFNAVGLLLVAPAPFFPLPKNSLFCLLAGLVSLGALD